jgi:hypothetical protein
VHHHSDPGQRCFGRGNGRGEQPAQCDHQAANLREGEVDQLISSRSAARVRVRLPGPRSARGMGTDPHDMEVWHGIAPQKLMLKKQLLVAWNLRLYR